MQVTDRCVEVFDHYCPWVGNVVAKGNRHLFLTMLLFFWAGLTGSIVLALLQLSKYLKLSHGARGPDFLYLVFFISLASFMDLGVSALAFAQAHQILRNVTTNELANWRRYRYMQTTSGKYFNPFDHGWRRNVLEAFQPHKTPSAPMHMTSSADITMADTHRHN